MTNFERIKGMSVEELAEILIEYDLDYECWKRVMGIAKLFREGDKNSAIKAQIEWLESEAEE